MTPTPIALLVSTLFLSANALADAPGAEAPPVVMLHDHLVQAESARAGAESARATAEAWRAWGDELRASLGTTYGSRLGSGKVVKGAPYSADVTTESNQPLPDGNVISKKTTGRVYRDAEGRTRQETVVDGTPKSIQIADPVEKKSVMLLPGSKKAVTMPHMVFSTKGETKDVQVVKVNGREIRIENGKVSVDGKEAAGIVSLDAGGKSIRVENGKVTIDGKEFTPPATPTPPAPGHATIETETRDGLRRETVRVQVVSAGDADGSRAFAWQGAPGAPMPPLPPIPPAPPGSSSKAKAVTSSLGFKEFDGVRAEGKLVQQTIAAGEIGNRNPIQITTETWYSPDLQVTVYSRHNDPRRGETVYRLTNIRRAEQAADLFKVPEEYTATGKRAKG